MTAFHDLTPELFSSQVDHLAEQPTPTWEAPQAWVDRMMNALLFATAASDGMVNGTSVLGNRDIERIYACTDDETVGGYLERMTKTARAINASRLFFARTTAVVKETMSGETSLATGVLWFAQDENGARHQGIVVTDDGKLVSSEVSAELEGEVIPLLHKVLPQA